MIPFPFVIGVTVLPLEAGVAPVSCIALVSISARLVENTRSNDGSLSKHSTLETGTQLNLISEGFTLMYTTTSTGMETYAYDPDAKEVTEASRSVLSELRVDAETVTIKFSVRKFLYEWETYSNEITFNFHCNQTY